MQQLGRLESSNNRAGRGQGYVMAYQPVKELQGCGGTVLPNKLVHLAYGLDEAWTGPRGVDAEGIFWSTRHVLHKLPI